MDHDSCPTLGALFFRNVERFSFARLLTWSKGAGTEMSYSTTEFADAVFRLAQWLGRSGFEPGDRVAIYSENRPEWHIVDFAAHLAQVVLVPVYPTLAAHQMEQILQHAGAKAVFCGTEQLERIQSVRSELPELAHVIALDEDLKALLSAAPPPSASEKDAFRFRALAADPETVATIVYTSGTTGTPKGVMLSHRNLMFDVCASLKKLPDRRVPLALSVLPLSHVLERILCYGYFYRGIPIAYGDPHKLKDLLTKYRPGVMGAVPRILEKMKDAIEAKIALMPAHRQRISQFLLGVGYARDQRDRSFRTSLQAALHPLAHALMFRKVHEQMGNIEVFVCGGAWLNPELERYFRALGFGVIQGYGLTETSPVITCNQYGAERVGSVGDPIDGVEIRIDADGEILTRGPNVMQGYFRDGAGTAAVFRDGWFATGDLGRIEDGRYLVITGRRKEMLLLSNGKNIYYAPIEQALRKSRLVEQAFVIGEGRNYTTLLLVANTVGLLQHAAENGILDELPQPPVEDLLLHPQVLASFRETLDELQAPFSRFEQAKRFCFLPEEALLDIELVTPTQKVRRAVLERKYAKYIEQLYREDRPFVIPVSAASAPVAPAPVS